MIKELIQQLKLVKRIAQLENLHSFPVITYPIFFLKETNQEITKINNRIEKRGSNGHRKEHSDKSSHHNDINNGFSKKKESVLVYDGIHHL